MKLLLITILFVATLFGSELEFTSDYNAALKQAKAENKDIYMLVTSESCKWCRKFENKTLVNIPLVKKIEKEYVILHVTRDFDYIPAKFKVKRVPKHFFLTQNAEEIYSFLGYWNVEDFSSFLDEVQKKKKKD